MTSHIQAERVFSAIGEKNRKKIVELLYQGDSTLLELQKEFDISFQALSKHVKILESSGIVTKHKKGKYRVLSLNKKSLLVGLHWISHYADFWNESFDKLEAKINERNKDEQK